MGSVSYNASLRILLVTIVCLSVVAMVTGGYLGPRYGKRLPSGQRTIQSRSQARFYAGSRYGGKRSYWPTALTAPDAERADQTNPSNSPYDCFLVPYVGLRCALRSEEGASGGMGAWRGDSDSPDDYPPPSMIRTTLIGDGGHSSSSGASPAVQAVMGSEA